VLDVQKDFTSETAKMPVDKSIVPSMIDNIHAVESRFNANNKPVIYIRNVFSRLDIVANLFRHLAAVEGTAGVDYDPRLKVLDGNQFVKSEPDMFSNRELETFLVTNHVGHLYMTGVFADQCVYWSSKSALNRKYTVTVIADAVASSDKKMAESACKRLQSLGAQVETTEQVMRH